MKCRKEYVEINARMIHLHDSSWNLIIIFLPLNIMLKKLDNWISVNRDEIILTHVPWDMAMDEEVQFIAIRQLHVSGSNDLDKMFMC